MMPAAPIFGPVGVMDATTSVRGPNCVMRPFFKDKQFVGDLHDCRPVGDHHDDRAIVTGLFDRAHQRSFANCIEIGVRLVQHDQARAIVKASRKADALPLTAGKGQPPVADRRIVAKRQAPDHFMHIGKPRRFEHPVRIAFAHARDIILDGAFKKRHRLRQIAGNLSEGSALPEIDIVSVEENAAGCGL